MKNIYNLLLVLIIIISISFNLTYLFSQSIRLDESQSIWVSTKSVPTLLKMNGQDVQTPLYSLLLHFWIQLFGSDIAITRLLSLFFYLATIPALYILIHESATKSTAYLGVALFALSPFIIWYSQEARTYTLLTLLATLSHIYFLRFVRSNGSQGKFGYWSASLLGLYSHYFFVFLITSQALYLLRSSSHVVLRRFGILVMLVGLFFSPWLYYVYRLGLAANTQPLIPPPTSFNVIQVYVNFVLGFQSQSIQSLIVSLWPLFLMVLFIVFTRRLRIRLHQVDYFLIVSVVPVILVFTASFYKPIFLARYLIFVIPSLFTVFAWVIINVGRKLMSGLSIAIIVLMLISLNVQARSLATPVKEDYKEVVSYLVAQTTPRDIVTVSAPFTVYPIEYYYNGYARIDTIPEWNRFTQGPIPAFNQDSLQKQLDTYAKIYYRIFMVLSYNQGYQDEIIDYMDHRYQLLATKNFPSNIILRVYQLRYD